MIRSVSVLSVLVLRIPVLRRVAVCIGFITAILKPESYRKAIRFYE